MKLSDDFDNENIKSGFSLGTMIVGIVVFVLVVVVSVLYVNREQFNKKPNEHLPKVEVSQNSAMDKEYAIGQSNLTSDDLDFWDMYKEDDPFIKEDTPKTAKDYAERLKELEKEEAEKAKEDDLSENGTKTEVILPDGTSQWVMINAYVEKNTYDYTGLVCEEPFMRYYSNSKKISKQGILLDESYGMVDFNAVNDAGVEFCILRIGKRGYSTGEISIDPTFSYNVEQARTAGLKIGVSFYSQANSKDEAVEEAMTVIQQLNNYEVKPDYPIVFDMEYVSGDESRTSKLTKAQLTEIAQAFCNTIKENGYIPLVYGDKYWLLRKLDLVPLNQYGVFLSQNKDVPDYPYQFAMWEYKNDAKISGISQDVAMCISFVDYDMR